MELVDIVFLGILQGLTEFLPVSSSGHLVLGQYLLGIKSPGNTLEILFHLGTLGSVVFVFFDEIKNIVFTIDKKSTQIGSGDDLSFPISGFFTSSQGGKYYNIECWIITGVKDGVSQYAQMRMGTNKAGAFSYVVEGTKTRNLTQYNTKFRKK